MELKLWMSAVSSEARPACSFHLRFTGAYIDHSQMRQLVRWRSRHRLGFNRFSNKSDYLVTHMPQSTGEREVSPSTPSCDFPPGEHTIVDFVRGTLKIVASIPVLTEQIVSDIFRKAILFQ